jgi:FkbM family methyltransferase
MGRQFIRVCSAKQESVVMAMAEARHRLAHTFRSVCPQPVLNWRETQFYARYGEIELHFLDILCERNRDAIDVGANDGCYVHFLRRCARHVHAFEPIPALAQALSRKFISGVTVYPVALSRVAGSAILHMPRDAGSPILACSTLSSHASSTYAGTDDIPVETATLDEVYGDDAGFIKIDVEGHEDDVLDGAGRTIEWCRPNILVEIIERLSPGGVERAIARFKRLDYRGAFIYRGRLLSVDAFSAAIMQRDEDYPDLHASLTEHERFGPYIYNFIFVPRDKAARIFRDIARRVATL